MRRLNDIFSSVLIRKLAGVVLLSILIVELIILLPSMSNHKERQLQQLERKALLLISTLDSAALRNGSGANASLASHLDNHSTVLGYSICTVKDCPVTFGELTRQPRNNNRWLSGDERRLEVTAKLNNVAEPTWVTLRTNSSRIRAETQRYVLNVIGLIAIIAMFVTAATVLATAVLVIFPIRELRDRILQARNDPKHPERYQLKAGGKGEITDLTNSYNALAGDVGTYLSELEQSRAGLEKNLLSSEARWKFALESSGDGVWDWNPLAGEIFFSGFSDGQLMGGSGEQAAGDWISDVHPEDIDQVAYYMRKHLKGESDRFSCECRVRNKSGGWSWVMARGMVINRNRDKRANRVVGTMTDISDQKAAAQKIWCEANLDQLTGLPNRRLFQDYLKQNVEQALIKKASMVLMFVDLDNFKIINDTHGHQEGDRVLIEAARRLQENTSEKDIISRLGGDEFTVILPEIDDQARLTRTAENILQALAQPFNINENQFHISASIGITTFPEDATNTETLIMNADQAMYAAKEQGRNRYCYFAQAMRSRAQARIQSINELHIAIEKKQFETYYQPIVNMNTGEILKVETLIRWQHPVHGLLGADAVIRLAEETGMIVEIGNWMFRESTMQLAKWRRTLSPNLQLSVNTSPVQYRSEGCVVNDWYAHMDTLGIPYHSLVVEITESMMLELDTEVSNKLQAFRDGGVKIALDDFGTGYSSLSYLQHVSSDILKIDRAFVQNIGNDARSSALCEEIIRIAHIFGMIVIAEGIETEAQATTLKRFDCDMGQGYLYSRPLPADEFTELLKRNTQQKNTAF